MPYRGILEMFAFETYGQRFLKIVYNGGKFTLTASMLPRKHDFDEACAAINEGVRIARANFSKTSQAILDRLVAICPEFRAHWDNPEESLSRDDDGTFTACGIFMQLTWFFREHYKAIQPSQMAALGEFLSQCMSAGDFDLANSVATCFVENIEGDECERELTRYMSPEVRKRSRA